MFAVHIVFNQEGKKKIGESLQCHLSSLSNLSEKLNQQGIEDKHIAFIEIVDSKEWDGWRHSSIGIASK